MATTVCKAILAISPADLCGIDVSLLQAQATLSTCAVPAAGTTSTLTRYLAALKAGTSQATMASTMQLPAPPAVIRAAIGTQATAMGLGWLVEGPETIEAVPVRVDGRLMGTVYLRDARRVIFYMLLQSTRDNFCATFDELKAPDGSRLFADKLSLDSGRAIIDALQGKEREGLSAAWIELLDKGMFSTAPLLLGLSNDATARETTTEGVWDPMTLQLGNFVAGAIHKHATTGLIAFMPVFKSPFAVNTKAHRLYKRRARVAYHVALDTIYAHIHRLRAGLMWELFPGYMLRLMPRVYARSGDHPKQQSDVGQMTSAASRSPCRFCQLPAAYLHLARVWDSKRVFVGPQGEPLMCLCAAAALDPTAPPALRRTAEGFGAVLLGRKPAPFTRTALAVSSPCAADAKGAAGILHNVGGLCRLVVLMVGTDKAGGAPLLAGEEAQALLTRIAQLRPYSGPASRVLPVSSAALGKRVPTNKYASLMLLMPGAAEGLMEPSVWLAYSNVCMILHRFLLSLQQDTVSARDCARITLEARVLVKKLMAFPHFRKRIKPHITLHMGALIPEVGPARSLCESRTEGFHALIKVLARLTKAGEEQHAAMLRMRGTMELCALVSSIRDLRRGAAEAGGGGRVAGGAGGAAGAGGGAGGAGGGAGGAGGAGSSTLYPPVTMAGRLSTLTSPPELSLVPCRAIVGMSRLPGFAPAARVSASTTLYLAGGRAGAGGRRVRGGKGAALGPTSSPIASTPLYHGVIAGELCFLLTGAEAPPAPGGNAAQRDARLAWRTALIGVTKSSRWPGDCLTKEHFNQRTMRLTAAGQELLIAGSGVTVHDTLRYGVDGGAVPPPVIFSRGGPFVSFPVKPDHPHLAGVGMGVAIGQVLGFLTLPASDKLLSGASALPRRAPQTFALLRSAYGDAEAAGDLELLMRGIMAPMRLYPRGEWTSYMLVGVGLVLRKEHVQVRHGGSPEEPLADCLWWYPQGGSHGRLQPQPLPAGVDVSESVLPVEEEEEEEEEEGDEGGSGSEEGEEGEEDDEDGEAEEDEELGEALTQCFCGEEPTRDMLECSNPECKHVSIHRSCTLLAGSRAAPPAGWLCKVCREDTRGGKKRGRG